MIFSGKVIFGKNGKASPKASSAEFCVSQKDIAKGLGAGPVILEMGFKQKPRQYILSKASCKMIRPKDETKLTIAVIKDNEFVMLSELKPSERNQLVFILEHILEDKHNSDIDKGNLERMLKKPWGVYKPTAPKPQPKKRELKGNEAVDLVRSSDGLPQSLLVLSITDASVRLNNRIFSLPLLQELILENINLDLERDSEVMTNFCRLSKLVSLSLARNSLTDFTERVWKNLPVSLKSLNLAHNRLTMLPRQMMELRNLQSLNVAFNPITFISDNICQLTQLTRLDVQHSALSIVPGTMFMGNRNYLDLNFSGIPKLYEEREMPETKVDVPRLEDFALAATYNKPDFSERKLPVHLRSLRDSRLYRCCGCDMVKPWLWPKNLQYEMVELRDVAQNFFYGHVLETKICTEVFRCSSCMQRYRRLRERLNPS